MRTCPCCGAEAEPTRTHCYECHYDLDHMCRETPLSTAEETAGSVAVTGTVQDQP